MSPALGQNKETSMNKKTFHISDILSITTGRLVSNRHIDGVYDVIGHLVGRDVWTHELVVYADQAREECCKQLGWPSEVPKVTDEDMKDIPGWLLKLEKKYGREHTLICPKDFASHDAGPIASAVEMADSDKVVVVVDLEEDFKN